MIDDKEFIEAWQKATRVKEVAEKFGVTTSNAYGKALLFRKSGVQLKLFAKRRTKSEYADLAKFAKQKLSGAK